MTHPHVHAEDLVAAWRGELLECVHRGHAVICDDTGQIMQAWGDPTALIYPRSSAKMLQALPLVESGAADAFGLTDQLLALACASHHAAKTHVDLVSKWLSNLGMSQDDLICGPLEPQNREMRDHLIREGQAPCRIHSNCSGKHAGFLTAAQHLNASKDYVALDHPLQVAIRAAIEDLAQEDSPTVGIDGCSAPNYAVTVHGLARAMSAFASAHTRFDTRSVAAARLAQAMRSHPVMVAGETGACTDLMRAMNGKVTVKGGADGVYVAIIPEKRLGVALKIADGSLAASECAVAAILVRLGVLDSDHPLAKARRTPPILNGAGLVTGQICPMPTLQ